jgi:hypothetical protein
MITQPCVIQMARALDEVVNALQSTQESVGEYCPSCRLEESKNIPSVITIINIKSPYERSQKNSFFFFFLRTLKLLPHGAKVPP